MEFIGADPEHPVTTPRGWIRYSTDTNNVGATFTSKETTTVTSIEKPANFTLNFSNKEYALSVRDAEKTKIQSGSQRIMGWTLLLKVIIL